MRMFHLLQSFDQLLFFLLGINGRPVHMSGGRVEPGSVAEKLDDPADCGAGALGDAVVNQDVGGLLRSVARARLHMTDDELVVEPLEQW